MDMTSAIKVCFRKYFDFKGRAARPEFWWFQLFIILTTLCLSFLAIQETMRNSPIIEVCIFILVFGTLLPSLAVMVRRLHDINLSGYWVIPYLILMFRDIVPLGISHHVPYVMSLSFHLLLIGYIGTGIYFLCKKGDAKINQYGPPLTFEKDYA